MCLHASVCWLTVWCPGGKRETLTALGPSFIKDGQVLASRLYETLNPRPLKLGPCGRQGDADRAGALIHQGGAGAGESAGHRARGLHERAVHAAGRRAIFPGRRGVLA